jgi:hypothetical protein
MRDSFAENAFLQLYANVSYLQFTKNKYWKQLIDGLAL